MMALCGILSVIGIGLCAVDDLRNNPEVREKAREKATDTLSVCVGVVHDLCAFGREVITGVRR